MDAVGSFQERHLKARTGCLEKPYLYTNNTHGAYIQSKVFEARKYGAVPAAVKNDGVIRYVEL